MNDIATEFIQLSCPNKKLLYLGGIAQFPAALLDRVEPRKKRPFWTELCSGDFSRAH